MVGVGIGATILVHIAPATLLVLIAAIGSLHRGLRARPPSPTPLNAARDIAVFGIVAAIVAAPYLVPLAWHYGFVIRNTLPLHWHYELLDANRWIDLLRTHATPSTALAVAGAWRLRRALTGSAAEAVVGYWGLATIVMLASAYARQWPPLSDVVPQIVPAFHFLSYGRALLALLAGVGLLQLAEWIARALPADVRPHATRLISIVLLAVATAAAVPRLTRRDDLGRPVADAAAMSADAPRIVASRWIREHLPANAVVLSSDDVALRVVGPAGRRVLAVSPHFANPYVDIHPRIPARVALITSIRSGDHAAACALAAPWQVSWIVWRDDEGALPDEPWLKVAYRHPPYRVIGLTCE